MIEGYIFPCYGIGAGFSEGTESFLQIQPCDTFKQNEPRS